MNYLRKWDGTFASKKWARFVFKLKIVGGVFSLSFLVFCAAQMNALIENKQVLSYAAGRAEASVLTNMSADKIEEMKQDVLNKLEKCENPHKKPIVFDSNGVASVGQFQWQPHSFQHYWEKKTGQKLTEKEAVVLALDDVKARELAYYVIFQTERGPQKDWVNCTRWHSLQTLVEFIKSHE